jgi:hypothetical protein
MIDFLIYDDSVQNCLSLYPSKETFRWKLLAQHPIVTKINWYFNLFAKINDFSFCKIHLKNLGSVKGFEKK